MLDLFGTCLEDKDLYIERTLVSAGERNILLVRILNASDKTQIIGAQTVVAVAKPGKRVAEFPWVDPHCSKCEVEKTQRGEENCGEALPDPLRELWNRRSEQLTEEESQAVAELLHRHKDVYPRCRRKISTAKVGKS